MYIQKNKNVGSCNNSEVQRRHLTYNIIMTVITYESYVMITPRR